MLHNPLLENKTEYKSEVLGEYLYNLLDQTFVIPQSFRFNIIEVSDGFVGRMDLISKQLYGDEAYQDILCKLNGISNPFELNEGDILIVPELDHIVDFYYVENEDEKEPTESSSASTTPQPKNKNEKRKPNEAVVGEKRFKIDPSKKVIIY